MAVQSPAAHCLLWLDAPQIGCLAMKTVPACKSEISAGCGGVSLSITCWNCHWYTSCELYYSLTQPSSRCEGTHSNPKCCSAHTARSSDVLLLNENRTAMTWTSVSSILPSVDGVGYHCCKSIIPSSCLVPLVQISSGDSKQAGSYHPARSWEQLNSLLALKIGW